MFSCKSCTHSEMVHVLFVGCCGVKQCPCTGMDDLTDRCQKPMHGDACGWTTVHPQLPELVSEAQAKEIWSLHLRGSGVKPIAAVSRVLRPNVRLVLAGFLWPDLVPAGCHRGPGVEPCEHPVDPKLVDATAERKRDRMYGSSSSSMYGW